MIKVCDGTACHVRKSIPILEGLYKELGLGKRNIQQMTSCLQWKLFPAWEPADWRLP